LAELGGTSFIICIFSARGLAEHDVEAPMEQASMLAMDVLACLLRVGFVGDAMQGRDFRM
jgi:hypothetical protein